MIYDKDHAVIVRIVVSGLLLAMLGLYVTVAVLLFQRNPIPGELWQAAGAALGAFSALLVSTRATQSGGQQPIQEVPDDATNGSAPQDVVAAGGLDPDTLGGHDVGVSALGVILAVLLVFIAVSLGIASHPIWLLLLVVAVVIVVLDHRSTRR